MVNIHEGKGECDDLTDYRSYFQSFYHTLLHLLNHHVSIIKCHSFISKIYFTVVCIHLFSYFIDVFDYGLAIVVLFHNNVFKCLDMYI